MRFILNPQAQKTLAQASRFFCCASIALRQFHQSNAIKQVEPPKTDLTKQFQKQTGAKLVLPTIKTSDTSVMMQLLRPYLTPDEHTITNPYRILDIGGDDGSYMLKPFFDIGMWLMPYVVEPVDKSLQQYKENMVRRKKVIPGSFFNKTLEDTPFDEIPPVNLTLCSHSLYYSRKLWEDVSGPLEQHLFSKLLGSIQKQGALCVILQSGDADLAPGKYGINAELEDLTYPITFRLEGKQGLFHPDHVSYTNAEKFRKAMKIYADRLKIEKGIEIKISSALSISQVNLGNINFKPNNEGRYIQEDEEAQQLILFYTKKYYNNYTDTEQQKLLDFIKTRCKTPENNYVMTHLNMVFVITTNEALKQTNRAMRLY